MGKRDPRILIPQDAYDDHGAEASVQLIFPPLVSSGIGHYYPSTAMLAAYLDDAGVSSGQINLNQEFAEYLFTDKILRLLGSGTFPGASLDSLSAATARWVSRRPHVFVDAVSGQLRSAVYEAGSALPKALGEPFLIDPGSSVLVALDDDDPRLRLYREFFEWSGAVPRARNASLIGISVPMGPQIVPALLLAGMIKDAGAGGRVVLGGPSMSLMSEDDLSVMLTHHTAVDSVVRYDGEYPIAALAAQALRGSWKPGSVAGVSFRAGDEIRHCAPGPGPDVRKLPRPKYSRDILARLARPYLSITQARGCYWGKCDYCDFVELYDGSPPFRGRHPEEFVQEIEELVNEFGISDFIFITESIPPAFARRMSRLLIDRDLRTRWVSFAMVDRRFNKELMALMAEAGCDHLVIGLETTITRLLKLVHKSADRAENIRFLRDAREAKLRLRVNLIPDLPSAAYDEAIQCLADIRELEDCIDAVAVFPFEPTRSSNVGRFPERFGLEPSASAGGTGIALYSLNHMDSTDPAMTAEERAEVHRLYQELEDSTVRRKRAALHDMRVSAQPSDVVTGRVRVPTDDIDVVVDGERVVCYDMRILERVEVPRHAIGPLLAHLDGEPFERSALDRAVRDSPGGESAVSALTQRALLVPAPAEAAASGPAGGQPAAGSC